MSAPPGHGGFFEARVASVDAKFGLWFNLPVESVAYVAIGSNLGDRELNLLMAVAELGKIAGCKVTALSNFYETTPVGMPAGTPSFYNAVARLNVTIDPAVLLAELQRIERERFGRRVSAQPESRKMDLDILFYDQLVLEDENLTVPHPRLSQRRFVLTPLAEIAPQLRHPVSGLTVTELLNALESEETVKRLVQ